MTDAEYALMTAMDAAHQAAIGMMLDEAGIHPEGPLALIKIVYGAELMPDHYVLRYADGSRVVMPWAVVDSRADTVGVDHWDFGDQSCQRGCAGCTAGCMHIHGHDDAWTRWHGEGDEAR